MQEKIDSLDVITETFVREINLRNIEKQTGTKTRKAASNVGTISPEQARIATLGPGFHTARFATIDGSHMEPIETGDSPDLHDRLGLLAHNRSRRKLTL